MRHIYVLLRHWQVAALLFVLLARPSGYAQAPAWRMVTTVNPTSGNFSQVTATAADGNGNLYIAGFFYRTMQLGTITLTSAGNTDAFVAKWSIITNSFVWAQRAGGTRDDQVMALAVSGVNVYVTGLFNSSAASFGNTTLAAAGGFYTDMFVAKLVDAGSTSSFTWAQRAGGTEEDQAYGIAVAGTNVYVGGYTKSINAGFGTFTLTNASTNGTSDGFVAKITDAGANASFAWVQRLGGTGDDVVSALAANGPNVYVAGNFRGTTATVGSTVLTTAGGSDGFIAKLIDNGFTSGFAWSQKMGGTGDDGAASVAINGTSVYVAGGFDGATANFGLVTLTNVGSGYADAYVTKLTDAGTTSNFVWAQAGGGPGQDYASALTASGTAIYIAGSFNGTTATFGTTVLNNMATLAGTRNLFVTKLTDVGSATAGFAWAQSASGTGLDESRSLSASGNSVFLGGSVTPIANFGSYSIASPAGTSVGFLASLTDPTLTATTPALHPERIGLFPNPAHNRATVQLPAGTGPATLTVLDALGRPIHTQTTAVSAAELDLSGLAPGLYAVRVQAGAAAATRRLVVE